MGFVLVLLSALLGLLPGHAPRPAALAAADQAVKGELTIELDPADQDRPLVLPRVLGPAGRPLVVLDPGHGGHDPGAKSPFDEKEEKAITLELASAVRDKLIDGGRVRVALTRDGDRYLALRDRYEIARRLGAGLFISIHADAAPHNDNARGATIYTLSEVASDREAALLAARENKSDVIRGVELAAQDEGVSRILIDLAQRESMDASADFASLLRREAVRFFPFRPEWHRFASLVVLKAPDMPSILFESGYLTNVADAAYIQSEEGRDQIATGMRRAIEAHFARRGAVS